MNFSQFLNAIRARRRLLYATLIATMAVAFALSLAMPSAYKANATLVLNYKGVDPLNGVVIPAQLMPGYMATQAGVIASMSVAQKVVDELKLADNEAGRRDFRKATQGQGNMRDWLAARLLKTVSVEASRDSSVISINVKADDARFAAAVANAFAAKYQETVIELRSAPMKNLSSYLSGQTGKLREELQAAHNKRASFLQQKGIVNVGERFDIENARLNELSSQLLTAQTQLAEAASRSRQAQGEDRESSPDVAASPLIQNLKASLAQAEANLAKIATRFHNAHPTYQAARSEVEKARSVLKDSMRSASASVGASARIAEQRVQALQAGLDAQKKRVLELNLARAELALLDREVDSMQKAYDASANRFHQINVEAFANQADVAVLNPATPPAKVSGPNVLFNSLLSAALGALLGIGAILIAELFDRRVRSTSDLELVRVPVLGSFRWSAPPANPEFRLATVRPVG